MSSDVVTSTAPHDTETIRLSLKTVVLAVWDSRKLIVASVVIAAVASAIISLLLPKEFESTATLLVMPPPFKEVKDVQQEQIGLFPRSIGVQDYALLLMQDAVLTEVVDRVNASGLLDQKQFEALKRPSVLRRKMEVEVTVNEKTAYGTKNSPALLLIARGPSPEIAQALAQAWGEVAQEKSLDLYKKSKGDQAKYILEQYNDVQLQLAKVLDEQQANEAAFNSEEFKLRLQAMTQLLSQQEDEYYKTLVEVDGLRKEVDSLRNRLAQEDRILTLFNSPPMTAVFLDKKLLPPSPGKSGNNEYQTSGFWTEQTNPVYVSTSELLIQRESSLAGKEEKLKSLERSLQDLRKSIDDYRTESAKLNREKKKLEKEESVYSKNYIELANRYQQAKIAEAEQQTMADIRLVADAIAPDKKVASQRSLIVILAVFLAFSASVSWSVARHVVRHILAGT